MKIPDRGWRRTAIGFGAAAAFAVVYLLVAPPARRWTAEHVAAPILDAAAGRGGGVVVTPRDDPPSVMVSAGANELAAYSIPLGVLFFVPTLLLLAIAPDRPYPLVFIAILLTLGLVDLAAVAAGLQWGRAGFIVHSFIESYVTRPASIAVPLWFLYGHRRPHVAAP